MTAAADFGQPLAVDFSGIPVLCVGDVMLDRFIYGEVERISPEAPVPVLRLTRTREMLGGAGNVASNIAALGGRAILVGLIGRDDSGTRVRRLVSEVEGIEPGLAETEARSTVSKTRLIAGQQQVVRTDEESRTPLSPQEAEALLSSARARMGEARALVLADYGKGVLGVATTAALIRMAREAGLPVLVDPKQPDFIAYRGATCITPNLKELAAASGMPVADEAQVVAAARKVLARAEAGAILVTRSEKGMTLVQASGEVSSVPARARDVFDVSGAGDTVIATMALGRAAGLSLPEAMPVANAAASIVVSKFGTATATMAEVERELASAGDVGTPSRAPPPRVGLQPLRGVRTQVETWRAQGLRVGFTNGCFDVLHTGHVSLLGQARAACDRLVVGLNSDASVRRLKGPSRPVNTLGHRAEVIGALRDVDAVVAFDEDTPLELIRALQPDVLVKGADYARDQVVGAEVVEARGGCVVLADLTPGQSSTGLIARLQGAAAG